MGWSQGGYISAFLATHDAARFKAISVGAGISDWMTYYVNTDIHPFTRQYLKATPWDDPEIYAKTSPITYIKQAKTPTLIQHGATDQRVPLPNAFELYQGLQDNNVPTKLIVYQGFGGIGHGPSKPKSHRATMEHNIEWFDQYLFQTALQRRRQQQPVGAVRRLHASTAAILSAVSAAIRPSPAVGASRSRRSRRGRRRRPAPPTRSSPSAARRSSPPRKARSRTARSSCAAARSRRSARTSPIPAGADVVDGTGKFVSPGIIDCHSHIAADSINEGGTTVSSMTGIEDVFDPTDVDIYRDLAGGVTTANVLHGSANPIGGKNYVIKLRWGKTRAEEFAFEGAMPGIKFALGENPKRRGGGAGAPGHRPARYPGDAHGRRVRDPRRVHPREGLPEGLAGLRPAQEGRRDRRARRGAICSSAIPN